MPHDGERSRCSDRNVQNQRRQEVKKCGTAEMDYNAADRIMKPTFSGLRDGTGQHEENAEQVEERGAAEDERGA